jgi:hypothetical protein
MTYPSPSALSDQMDETTRPPADEPPPSERQRRGRKDRPESERPPLFSQPHEGPAAETTNPRPPGRADYEDFSPDGRKDPGRAHRSDIRSTTKQRASTKRRLKRSIAASFGGATLRVNRMLARDQVELEYGPWVAAEDEKHGIAEPVAGLLSRRMGEGATSPDIADVIDALIAIAAYVSNSLSRRFELRRAVAAGEIVVPPAPPPDDDEPADAVPPV